MTRFEALADKARGCRFCAHDLPLGPRPVFQVSPMARLLVASQAPGTKVHASGVPFSDLSGDRLREWMGLSPGLFYEHRLVAILPMGFCYPGRRKGGDAPPRRECADLWRRKLLEGMTEIRLTLLVGSYAQADILGQGRMFERVRAFREYLPDYFPLPHPSWRSHLWAQRNPWFEDEVLPALKQEVRRAIGGWADGN
ncbi:uracil-DNA glycosylase family protein [Sphingosinicella rhizophila]|uniref:Uracil-DNA glycosylase family protein n=1 Tax=Sphingosinicella rhizophila TaxID=3050082 RepID=A0ABU3QCZ5_9SPHN|nr:uracil-DNA glycosylase family protein [Sphingosinicella sp. GR2756]MDT9600835.1 uracil-DNA glycosylase family protein [Sphingosinicella sp. GR2756]